MTSLPPGLRMRAISTMARAGSSTWCNNMLAKAQSTEAGGRGKASASPCNTVSQREATAGAKTARSWSSMAGERSTEKTVHPASSRPLVMKPAPAPRSAATMPWPAQPHTPARARARSRTSCGKKPWRSLSQSAATLSKYAALPFSMPPPLASGQRRLGALRLENARARGALSNDNAESGRSALLMTRGERLGRRFCLRLGTNGRSVWRRAGGRRQGLGGEEQNGGRARDARQP